MTCWNICRGFVCNAYLTLSLDLFGIQIASGVDLNSVSVSQEIYVYICCKLPAYTLWRGRGAGRTDCMPGKSSGSVNEYGLYPFSVQCSLGDLSFQGREGSYWTRPQVVIRDRRLRDCDREPKKANVGEGDGSRLSFRGISSSCLAPHLGARDDEEHHRWEAGMKQVFLPHLVLSKGEGSQALHA